MILNYIKSQSSAYPELIDTTSSKKYVYLRQNVVELQSENIDEESYTYYEYEEAKLTKEEYEHYLEEININDTLIKMENLENRIVELEENVATSDAMTDAILEGVNEV